MEVEIWKTIDGYPNYQVSNMGRVKRLATWYRCKSDSMQLRKEYIKGINVNDRGYGRMRISNENGAKAFQLHRLVAMAFIPNPDNLSTVNHKNFDKLDNRVENLEWCSFLDNNTHSASHGRKLKKLTVTQMQDIRTSNDMSNKQLAEKYGLVESYVWAVRDRYKNKKAINYIHQ